MRSLVAIFCCWSILAFADNSPDKWNGLAFELFKELVETDTTHSTGDTLRLARNLAARLKSEGIPAADIQVIEYGGKGNLVARLRSESPTAKPLLLLAHLDVVEADPADWGLDPMKLNEVDGYFYGRGTLDDKNEVAIHLVNFIRLHREQAPLTRDIILALTADEEGGPHNGAMYLVQNHRELVDAAFVFNEGGGGLISGGQHVANTVQAAEKTYQSYRLEITNPGGHSSLPRSDNAIYELARVLGKIEAYDFPVGLNETTRAYFSGTFLMEKGERASMFKGLLEEPPSPASIQYFRHEPAVNARLRTTCAPTQLEAGHAENALPQRAQAIINCRVLPGVAVEGVRQQLLFLADLPGLTITPTWEALSSDSSPLHEQVMAPIREITEEMWPGAMVIPTMSTGATDALFFRNVGIPVYGVSGIFRDLKENRTHGRDERILKRSFYEGLEFMYRLTRRVAVRNDRAEPVPIL